jgi:hypothetical protein
VELIDSAGGQTINGALTATGNITANPLTLTSGGPLLRNNAGVVEARINDNTAYAGFACLALQAGGNITCSSSNPTTILSSTTADTNAVFQVSANGTSRGYYGRIGGNVGLFTGAGSAVLTHDTSSNITCAANLTITGTTRLGTYTVGTLPSAAANTRARAFVTDSNLAFNSTNLGATVTAGGSTLVPVFSNGTNWVIG